MLGAILTSRAETFSKICRSDSALYSEFIDRSIEVIVNQLSLQTLLAATIFNNIKSQPEVLSEAVLKTYHSIVERRITSEGLSIDAILEHLRTMNGGKKTSSLNIADWYATNPLLAYLICSYIINRLMWNIVESLLRHGARMYPTIYISSLRYFDFI